MRRMCSHTLGDAVFKMSAELHACFQGAEIFAQLTLE